MWWRRERLKSCHNFRRIAWSRWEFRTHSISFPPSTIGDTVVGWIGLDRTGLNWHMLYFYCAWTTIIIFALNSLTFNISIAIPLPNRLRASFIFLTLSLTLRASIFHPEALPTHLRYNLHIYVYIFYCECANVRNAMTFGIGVADFSFHSFSLALFTAAAADSFFSCMCSFDNKSIQSHLFSSCKTL